MSVHWWPKSRAIVLSYFLDRISQGKKENKILEIGCGGGGNFFFLKQFGELTAIEPDENLIKIAQRHSYAKILKGSLPYEIPAIDEQFDIIALIEVLEHIEEDRAAIERIKGLLSDNGHLIITVPAFMFLWSEHDIYFQHKRRYTKKQLEKLLSDAGYNIVFCSYFNFLAFIPVLILRKTGVLNLIKRIKRKKADAANCLSDTDISRGGIIGAIFTFLAKIEAFLLRYIKFPFGVSILLIAKKK